MDYFRHRNAEKYSCLPLPIFLNNTRNALAGVKLAGAFLVEDQRIIRIAITV